MGAENLKFRLEKDSDLYALVAQIKQRYCSKPLCEQAINNTIAQIRQKGSLPETDINYARVMFFIEAVSRDIKHAETGIKNTGAGEITSLRGKYRVLQRELSRQFYRRHNELKDVSHPQIRFV